MATTPIITLDEALAAAPGRQVSDEEYLGTCIDAASEAIEGYCGRRFGAADYDVIHSGDLAVGSGRDGLFLVDPETERVTIPVAVVTEATEDGEALGTIVLPGDTTYPDGEAAVFMARTGYVRRATVSEGHIAWRRWAPGAGNVRLKYSAGWETTEMPADLKQLAIELTWLFYQEGGRSGLESLAMSEYTARFARLLTPYAKQILQRYRFSDFPVTVVG